MNAQKRRRQRILKSIAAYQEKLDRLDPSGYRREVDYRKVKTFYEHRIAGLTKLLKGEEVQE
jgi:hypothetical protein